jgi:hypothetical protein
MTQEPWTIHHGSVLDVARGLPEASFDALLCDPPYGLSFMGKRWDYQVPSVEEWAACLRALKPGAPLLAFGGSRTYHRLACNIEDAGFELRDQLCWLYAKGFPKSLNVGLAIDNAEGAEREVIGTRTLTGNAAVSTKEKGGTYGVQVGTVPAVEVPVTAPATDLAKAWDGYGTALKPAHEPIVLARRPLDGTMAENVARWGVGALAIDACRISTDGAERPLIQSVGRRTSKNVFGDGLNGSKAIGQTNVGRWPANLLLDEGAAEILDAEVGPRISGKAVRHNGGGGQIMSGLGDAPYKPKPPLPDLGYLDGKTNPSRFFFCSKVSTNEREAGCEGLPLRSAGEMTGDREEGSAALDSPRTGAGRGNGARNHHPTLKPISLTTWLARLIRPPVPGRILVPFAGAGSEMIGALLAGWPMVVGIEREADYLPIARARIAHWLKEDALSKSQQVLFQ